MAAGNTIGDLQNLINTFRQNGEIDGDELQDLYQTVHNVISGNNTSVLGLAYDAAIIYDTVATAETSGNPSYAEFGDRFWKSKTDNNQGNEPPSAAGTTENTHWIEVSKAEANAIKEWAPGLYGAGLIIVYHNDALLKLNVASRPFESVDIDAEITAEQWTDITGMLYPLDSTGTQIKFDRPRTYGTDLAPLTNGALTELEDSNSKNLIQKIYIQAASFSPPASWQKLATSEDYDPAVVNIIIVERERSDRKIYSITKDA